MHPARRSPVTVVLVALAAAAGWFVRRAAGLAAIACATVGVYLVTGSVGWALIAAVPFLLALDYLDGARR